MNAGPVGKARVVAHLPERRVITTPGFEELAEVAGSSSSSGPSPSTKQGDPGRRQAWRREVAEKALFEVSDTS